VEYVSKKECQGKLGDFYFASRKNSGKRLSKSVVFISNFPITFTSSPTHQLPVSLSLAAQILLF
jgi:hypothetical protein